MRPCSSAIYTPSGLMVIARRWYGLLKQVKIQKSVTIITPSGGRNTPTDQGFIAVKVICIQAEPS